MRWFQSSPGLGFTQSRAARECCRETTELIRAELIGMLQDTPERAARNVLLRIRHAADAQLLWDLRPEIMGLLAALHGEARARQLLARTGPMFREVLPAGLASTLRVAGAGPSHAALSAL